jgi:hypothetical protein
MHDDHFAAMIRGLERGGVSRNQIAQNCRISAVTLWRMAEIRDWKPGPVTLWRLEQLHRQSQPEQNQRLTATVK